MSSYHGRRAPNVSQYVANLNTIPSAADMAARQDFGNLDDDLALFANTQFFDFDMGENVPDVPPTDMNFNSQRPDSKGQQELNSNVGFVNQSGYCFDDFSNFQQPVDADRLSLQSLPPTPPNGIPGTFQLQQSQPTVPTTAHFAASDPQVGEKRNSAAAFMPTALDLEEVSRMAAEEDKRRRNTAASARFRVKKKQREQALEKTAKVMSEKVQVLEARVGQLEMENKWLKGLIMEKNIKLDGKPFTSAKSVKNKVDTPTEGENAVAKVGSKDKDVEEIILSDPREKETIEIAFEDKKRGVGTGGSA